MTKERYVQRIKKFLDLQSFEFWTKGSNLKFWVLNEGFKSQNHSKFGKLKTGKFQNNTQRKNHCNTVLWCFRKTETRIKLILIAQKMKFSIKDLFSNCDQIRRVTFTEEILNGKLHFLCSDSESLLNSDSRYFTLNVLI